MGMSLAEPHKNPQFFEYFLNPGNHAPGIPLDIISYHFYAVPEADEPSEAMPFTFFAKADGFLNLVRSIDSIRQRLSPGTKTDINETGCILASDILGVKSRLGKFDSKFLFGTSVALPSRTCMRVWPGKESRFSANLNYSDIPRSSQACRCWTGTPGSRMRDIGFKATARQFWTGRQTRRRHRNGPGAVCPGLCSS